MNTAGIDVSTVLRLGGVVYIVMSAAVWLTLMRRHDRISLLTWCCGSAAAGMGYLLLGLRNSLPELFTVYAANAMLWAAFPLRVASLRIEMNARLSVRVGVGIFCAAAAVWWTATGISVPVRVLTATALQMMGTWWMAWTAARVARVTGLRSARLIAHTYAAFAFTLVLSVAGIGLGGWIKVVGDPSIGVIFALVAGICAAVGGNIGFIGMALERAHLQEISHTANLSRESALRIAAEGHAGRLREWLDERESLLRILAHEVRQPLNNAQAALEAAHRSLDPGTADSALADQGVQRARIVLRQIIGTLDNNLAATALLASPENIARRDSDIDMLMALSIGDLDAAVRQRVQIERIALTRTATMDAGLMRLALRNVLSNALTYSPQGSPVVLRVSDSEEPLGLIFEIVDSGSGLSEALVPRVFERGTRGDSRVPGHGLGLYVVHQVMSLHRGSAEYQPNPAGGSVFRLVLPQDVADHICVDNAQDPLLSSPRNEYPTPA
jgi:signal transduction histidine kinase